MHLFDTLILQILNQILILQTFGLYDRDGDMISGSNITSTK